MLTTVNNEMTLSWIGASPFALRRQIYELFKIILD